jgi:hypothetical protein
MSLRATLPRALLGLAVVAGALGLALNRGSLDPALIESTIGELGWWAPLGHVVLFALGTVLFMPGSLFGLAGGVLFGPAWGTVVNLAGATLGATAAFLTARYLAADRIRRMASGRLAGLVSFVEGEGWRFVAFACAARGHGPLEPSGPARGTSLLSATGLGRGRRRTSRILHGDQRDCRADVLSGVVVAALIGERRTVCLDLAQRATPLRGVE